MRKCNDEAYQLAKDQALVKKLKNKRCRPFCLCLPGVMFVTRNFSNQITEADEACRPSEISLDLIIIIVFL
jgi:hypothetical protein